MVNLIFNLMVNDIKIYLRQDKKTYINFIIKVLIFTLMYINIGPNLKKYSENIFLFLFSAILFQGTWSINILCVSQDVLNNTKFLFTLPINAKSFILSKNLLLFIILITEFFIIELIFILSGLLPITHLNKCVYFITALIFNISISNILFKINHKRDDSNVGSIANSIIQGYKLLFILSAFTSVILFVIIKSYKSFVFKLPISIILYIFSFKILEKNIINQGSFLEETDL